MTLEPFHRSTYHFLTWRSNSYRLQEGFSFLFMIPATPRREAFVPPEVACLCRIPDSHGWNFWNSPFVGDLVTRIFSVTVGRRDVLVTWLTDI
ncbi:hypothetical protein AVEN_213132-1 [Araneus ventricosus]|uniref:Uncharacterized protein n=1 Tax=Araneus ventricosus TaxID=182803 RepID=A0A4Y2T4F5_ARAVE|nr:hypothetical protein AVEN_213132-1 [Araneus ventricosus]